MNFGIGGPVRLASTFMVSCCALAPSAIAAIAARTAGTNLGPVTKQLCQPLSNVRGSDALSEPRTLESGCRRLDWLFPDRCSVCIRGHFHHRAELLEQFPDLGAVAHGDDLRSEEHTSELQSLRH